MSENWTDERRFVIVVECSTGDAVLVPTVLPALKKYVAHLESGESKDILEVLDCGEGVRLIAIGTPCGVDITKEKLPF